MTFKIFDANFKEKGVMILKKHMVVKPFLCALLALSVFASFSCMSAAAASPKSDSSASVKTFVSSYIANEKTVTVTQAYSFAAPIQVASEIKNGYLRSTYNYDDGTYKGTLSAVEIENWSQTPYYANNAEYVYSFVVVYSGTVTKYN